MQLSFTEMHVRDKPAAALVASAVTFTSPGTAENISSASQLAYVDEQEAFIQEAFTHMTVAGTPTHVPLPLTILALILVILGTIGSAVGAHLMKWSHETETHLPWHKRWRLWLGFFFALILLFACDAWSFAVLPLSLIAPFGGLPIVISAVLTATGTCGVREPLDVCDIISMLAIFSGVTIVSVVTVSSGYTENSLDALAKNALGNPVFIVLGCITAVFDAFWISVHLVPSIRAKTIDVWEADGAVWPQICSALMCAANAGFQQVFMKTVSETVHDLGSGVPPQRVAGHWAAWTGLFGLLSFGACSAIVLQFLLGPGRSISIAVPAYQSLTMIVTVAVGAYFLHELEVHRDFLSVFSFGSGIALVIVGLCFLAYRREELLRASREKKVAEKEAKKSDGEKKTETVDEADTAAPPAPSP